MISVLQTIEFVLLIPLVVSAAIAGGVGIDRWRKLNGEDRY